MSHPEDQTKNTGNPNEGKPKALESDAKEAVHEETKSSKSASNAQKDPKENKDSVKTEATSDTKSRSETPAKEAKSTSESTPKVAKARPAARPAAARPRPAAAKKEEKPPEPSPLEPLLKQFVEDIKEKVHEEAVVESYVNRASGHIPTIVVSLDHWGEVARLLKESPSFSFDYLRSLGGVDEKTHMEVFYQFTSLEKQHHLAVRVKTDRENPCVPTVSHLWKAANWNERETYDLLGIRFNGHPDLRRILLPDDWVGHPLRKDYEQLDKEV